MSPPSLSSACIFLFCHFAAWGIFKCVAGFCSSCRILLKRVLFLPFSASSFPSHAPYIYILNLHTHAFTSLSHFSTFPLSPSPFPLFPLSPFPATAAVARYIRGEIPKLPWCETQVNLETIAIVDQLVRMNTALMLTINSQPRVNAAPSADPAVGWGGAGGYVFQKVPQWEGQSDENMI
jgi:hypothetical protein